MIKRTLSYLKYTFNSTTIGTTLLGKLLHMHVGIYRDEHCDDIFLKGIDS